MMESKKSKILMAARTIFLRYGYRRVNMNEIATAVGVSRPALYVLFKNKEEIFKSVYLQWVDETIAQIQVELQSLTSFEERIERAFEIWTVRPFELMLTSPEARELVECSFQFAQDALTQGYDTFEAAIVPILNSNMLQSANLKMTPERTAHILVSAVRGFKQAAKTREELRMLIKDLLSLSFRS